MLKFTYRCWSVLFALVLTLSLGFGAAPLPSVMANSTAQALNFSQDWNDTNQITSDHDWSGVPGIEGYSGSGLTTATGVDPQTVTADGGTLSVLANRSAPDSLPTGGVAEFELIDPVVALQGSSSADAPYLLINLDTTEKTDISVDYTLLDLDASADNAVQPVALQYRVGNSGAFINLPQAFVADATQGPYLAVKETMVAANLPVEAQNKPLVQVRIITTNAAGSDEWVGIDDLRIFANNDFGPMVIAVTPANNAFGVDLNSTFTVQFTEPVTLDESFIYFECWLSPRVETDVYPVAPDSNGFSDRFEIVPESDLPAGDECKLTIPYEAIADMPIHGFTSAVFTAGCGTPYNHMRWLHEEGFLSLGQSYMVEGVVTAYAPDMGGYFLQDPNPDSDPSTSEGIFVNDPGRIVAPGERIRLYGMLIEYDSPPASFGQHYHQKEIVLEAGIERCDAGNIIEPVVIDLPLTGSTLEQYEGMLVTIPEALTVQQNYFQGRFGQLTLAADGRVFNPNNGQGGTLDDAIARMIVLDDGSHQQNPRPLPYYAADGAVRAGDTLSGLTGVLDQGRINSARPDDPDFSAEFPNVYYRLHPTHPPVFTPANPRSASAAPPDVGEQLKVAGFNVHNFFTTLDATPYPAASPYDSINTPRGADDAEELTRQTDKLVAALTALDAEVVGLTEVEAWQGADAVDALLAALNAELGTGTYAAVPDPAGFPYPQKLPEIGGDFIKVALIYKPASVTPLGPSLMDNDPVYSRVPLAQTFSANTDGEVFSVVVNHFKSKGSCPDGVSDLNRDYGQGCWNALREQQAQRLLTFVEDVQTASADPDVLVIGDLNAYGAEEPVAVLTSGGLTDLVAAYVPAADRYSYIFDGQSGYLDHALATESLAGQVTDAAFWHINADEPSLIDYNSEYKSVDLYADHFFRSSDHDPLLVGLNIEIPPPAVTYDLFLPVVGR
ncbi:MAG: ExeM/NucH family extracellular endonuclease [Bellilinea sp.]